MKKTVLKVPAMVGIVSLSLVLSHVFAETQNRDHENNRQNFTDQHDSNKNSEEMNHEDGNNDDGDNNGMNDQEESDNESSLHDHFAQIPDVKATIVVTQVDVTKVNTYADIVTLLNQYRDTINQIKNKGNMADFASSTLSTQEKLILSKITSKHSFELSRTTVRANELLAQIKDLTDVLIPLGTQTISAELNLKNLFISQLNDFTSTINSLTDLADTTSTIFDEETN